MGSGSKDVRRIRGGSGLGDSIYVRPIAEHFVHAGAKVSVLSNFPDVFHGSGAAVEPFSRTNGVNVIAHYVRGKERDGTTQWEDVCRSAGVRAALRFEWHVRNAALVDDIRGRAAGRPVILVHGGRAPMARTDGFGMELLPTKAAFDAALGELSDCFLVQVGKATQFYTLPVDVDLNGSTSVADLLDLGSICEGVVAQCSFAIPLAEVFDKPLLAIWSARAARSETQFIRQTTPKKVLSGPRDSFVVDSWPANQIREVAREFRFV